MKINYACPSKRQISAPLVLSLYKILDIYRLRFNIFLRFFAEKKCLLSLENRLFASKKAIGFSPIKKIGFPPIAGLAYINNYISVMF